MKIGIFDSGLGGLVIANSIFKQLPKYDYIYLGDTKNLPYGEKSPTEIYRYTKKAVEFLFKQNCQLIIIACNTASALALRKLQKEFLPKSYPNRRILGVVVPTLEAVNKPINLKVGVIGTVATIKSHIYKKELSKINPKIKIFELATPKLVPLIEANSLQTAAKTLESYLKIFQNKKINALILGCTHYPLLKEETRKLVSRGVKVISQDDIVPGKLVDYLRRHSEIERKLTKHRNREFFVTAVNTDFTKVAKRLFGKSLKLKEVKIGLNKSQ